MNQTSQNSEIQVRLPGSGELCTFPLNSNTRFSDVFRTLIGKGCFARNTVDTLLYTRKLSIMAMMAQEEGRKIRERLWAGIRMSREKGMLCGNGHLKWDSPASSHASCAIPPTWVTASTTVPGPPICRSTAGGHDIVNLAAADPIFQVR